MSFDFCLKHAKRYEKGRSVCVGCHAEAVVRNQELLTQVEQLVAETNKRKAELEKKASNFDKVAYMREYMRKRRAAQRAAA